MPTGVYPRKSVSERFWEKVHVVFVGDACWLWKASTYVTGYGIFRYHGRYTRASRVSYELVYGAFDSSLWVLHHCDNPLCVRPDHLFLGAHVDNREDMFRKGRQRRKLTPEQVLEIRKSSEPHAVLASRYGVAKTHISRIKRNLFWQTPVSFVPPAKK